MLNEIPGSTTSPLERGRAVAWRRAGVCHDYQNLKNAPQKQNIKNKSTSHPQIASCFVPRSRNDAARSQSLPSYSRLYEKRSKAERRSNLV